MSLKKNLEILQAAGFDVPVVTHRFAEDQDFRQRGVRSVWRCNCGFVYESPIDGLIEFDHGCGRVAKEIWSAVDGFR